MDWKKLGLVFDVKKYINNSWIHNSALTPQPIKISDSLIRVFTGFRDAKGISRIGYVDIDSVTKNVVQVSLTPSLDIGRNGCFDDNGVILGDVIRKDGDLYLFYVGFQLVNKVKFLAFSGIAISQNNGDTFNRVYESPIIDRAPYQNMIGAIHTAYFENDRWRIWFARGDNWEFINGTSYPRYHVCYTEATDLLKIDSANAISCIPSSEQHYRIGRPKVYRTLNNEYLMITTRGSINGEYFPQIYHSSNGINWNIDSSFHLGIELSPSGWDSNTLCYPTLINVNQQTWMIYNGNSMGVDGFGIAITDNNFIK